MRRGLLLTGAGLLLLCVAGVAQGRVVTGAVVNDLSGAPVGRALVTSADGRIAQLTDGEGRFRVEVGDGSVVLSARRPGYLTMARGVEVAAGAASAELRLRPEAVVAGRVETGDGRAARGAGITLLERQVDDGRMRWVQRASAAVSFDGSYRMAGLEPGEYRVETREWAEGEERATGGLPEVGYPPVQGGVLRVEVGQQVEANLQLRAARYYPVEMPIANCGAGPGEGGMGVRVEVHGANGAEYALGYEGTGLLVNGGNGSEMATGVGAVKGALPRGSYTVELECYGREPRVSEITLVVGEGPVRTGPVTIGTGSSVPVQVREEYTATGGQSGSAPGSAGDSTYRRRPASVHLMRVDAAPGDEEVGRMRPDGQGGSALVGVGPGRYWVRVQARQGYVAAATCGGVDLRRAPLVVGSGGGAQPLELVLRDDTGQVTGRVPAGVRTVRLLPVDNEMQAERDATAGADGTFSAAGLAPGRWLVLGSGAEVVPIAFRETEVERRWESRGAVVDVPAGGTATVAVAGVASPAAGEEAGQ